MAILRLPIFKTLLVVASIFCLNFGGQARGGVPVIVDTDMESDVDDVGAMAMVHALADSGEFDLLGVMVCAKNAWSTLAADRINTYFGRKNLPLGQLKGPGVDRASAYAKQVAEEFPGKLASAADAPDAVGEYRKILAGQADGWVVILSIGYTTNLRDLLASAGDTHSALNGRDLVAQKVRIWVCMGGQFPSGREANIRWDTAASVEVIPAWPTGIIFAGWEVGLMDTGQNILTLPATSPVRRAYQLFNKIPHKSWDQVAVLYAARGLPRGLDNGPSAYHWELSAPGRIVISPIDGSNTWTADPQGAHRHLIQKSTNTVIANEINPLMMHLPPPGAPTAYVVTAGNTSPLAGAKVTITARLTDENGRHVAEAGRTLTWSSTNGGSLSAAQTLTDATGMAGVTFTTSSVTGTAHVVSAVDADGLTGSSPTILTLDPSADTHILAHYRFDESPGAADPGNPVLNRGVGGAALDLTHTGGPDGRNNTGGGGYGAPAYEGFGTAFNIPASGNGNVHTAKTATGGGLLTSENIFQSALQGASGAFTYEALVNISSTGGEQNIIAHDGLSDRGLLFRVLNGELSFYPGNATGLAEIKAVIPTSGPHAFVANQWFHVAISYSGVEGAAGNVSFYWTRLSPETSAGNLIAGRTLAADLPGGISNPLGIGTTTRDFFRYELRGLIDEVRISGIARQPGDFVFIKKAVPGIIDTDQDGVPDEWETANGLDPNVSNIGIDTDGDGISDFMEYALGLDPQRSDRAGLPIGRMESGLLTLTVTRNPNASHLIYEIQVSDDLEKWETGAGKMIVLTDTPELLKARAEVSAPADARRFIRLKVTAPK